MDIFYRKRAFLFIQLFDDLATTKKVFHEKLKKIFQQYKRMKELLLTSDLNQSYVQSCIFIIDLNIKKLEALEFLITQGDAEWSIFELFIETNIKRFAETQANVRLGVLNIDRVGDYKKKFFYILKKYGIINSLQWTTFRQLNVARDNLSLAHLNDFFLDNDNFGLAPEHMFMNKEIADFQSEPLTFRKFDCYFWNFIQSLLNRNMKYNELATHILKESNYDYDQIVAMIDNFVNQKNELQFFVQIKDFLGTDEQLNDFFYELKNILKQTKNKIGLIHFYFEQFSLTRDNKLNQFMLHLMLFFLASENPNLIFNHSHHASRINEEKFLHAEYHLDLILMLLNKAIYIEKFWNTKMENNFSNLNFIELSIFENIKAIKRLKNWNQPYFLNFLNKVRTIIKHPLYKKRFEPHLKKYFTCFTPYLSPKPKKSK